ncbi:hypothetical protein GA0115259_112435, partial [Streptomyces sp. MnatMP-M17]
MLSAGSLLLSGVLTACGGGAEDTPPDAKAASPVTATTAPAA